MKYFESYARNLAAIFAAGTQREIQNSRALELIRSGIEPREAVLRIALRSKGTLSPAMLIRWGWLTDEFPEPKIREEEATEEDTVKSFSVKEGKITLQFASGLEKTWKLS